MDKFYNKMIDVDEGLRRTNTKAHVMLISLPIPESKKNEFFEESRKISGNDFQKIRELHDRLKLYIDLLPSTIAKYRQATQRKFEQGADGGAIALIVLQEFYYLDKMIEYCIDQPQHHLATTLMHSDEELRKMYDMIADVPGIEKDILARTQSYFVIKSGKTVDTLPGEDDINKILSSLQTFLGRDPIKPIGGNVLVSILESQESDNMYDKIKLSSIATAMITTLERYGILSRNQELAESIQKMQPLKSNSYWDYLHTLLSVCEVLKMSFKNYKNHQENSENIQ